MTDRQSRRVPLSMLRTKLRAAVELARPGNALMTAFAVWVGGDVGTNDLCPSCAVIGAVAAAFVAAWGNAINDIYDRNVDAKDKAHRPLPSGRLTVREAAVVASSFIVLGVTVIGFMNSLSLFVVLGTIALLWAYSYRLKGMLVLGNMAVAFLAGLAFLFGAVVQGESFASILPQAWVAFGFAFLWHLAREWVKAAEDVEGDKSAGLNTLAVAHGSKPATRAAAILLALVAIGLWLPYFLGYFSGVYLLLVAFGVLPILIGTIPILWSGADSERLGQLARILKWDMLVGVCAIWFGVA